jgi:hypothetical protein
MKFIPCNELSQIYSFNRTNRKSFYRDKIDEMKKREELKKQFKKLRSHDKRTYK